MTTLHTVLTRAEKNINLNLEGDDDEEARRKLIELILYIIVDDLIHDRVSRQVKLMEKLSNCEHETEKYLNQFIIWVNNAVSI